MGTADWLIILVSLVLLPSAILQGVLNIEERIAFLSFAPVALAAALFSERLRVQKFLALFLAALIVVGIMGSIAAGSSSQFLMSIVLVISVVVGKALSVTLRKPQALRAITLFTVLLLSGGVVGLLYALASGAPLAEVEVGYRTSYLYLTTFSLTEMGGFFRPAGVFDEPGTFAMYAALVSMFNDVLGQNRRLNIAIIVMIVLTGSLAGLALSVLYLITSNYTNKYRAKAFATIAILLAGYGALYFVDPANVVSSALDSFYSQRLEVADGRLEGDNRSVQIDEFLSKVDEDMLLRGANASTQDYDERDQSSNPFSITYGYGLIISIPYFALILWLLFVTVKNRFRNSYTSLGLMLLLLQRPYIYNMMWAFVLATTVWLLYSTSRRGTNVTTA